MNLAAINALLLAARAFLSAGMLAEAASAARLAASMLVGEGGAS